MFLKNKILFWCSKILKKYKKSLYIFYRLKSVDYFTKEE